MKLTLKAATVLTWFNLIIWGYFLFNGLLGVLSVGALPILIMIVLLSAIPLNAYAALQLHKSIRHPEIKLSSSTPTGIRFVGIVAFLFAFLLILAGTTFCKIRGSCFARSRNNIRMSNRWKSS